MEKWIHSSLRTFLKITSCFFKLTYKMINMIHPQMRWNQSLPFLKHIENKFDLGSVLRGPQFTMPNANAWPGCGLKSKLPAARQSAPRFYADAVKIVTTQISRDFQFLTPPFITPQQQVHVEKTTQEKNKTLKQKQKKIPRKKSHLVCNEREKRFSF